MTLLKYNCLIGDIRAENSAIVERARELGQKIALIMVGGEPIEVNSWEYQTLSDAGI